MTDSLDRRGFFEPRRLLRAVTRLQGDVENSLEAVERLAAGPLVTLSREAMACLFEIQFAAAEADRRTAAIAFDEIDRLEEQLTVYSEESEVSRINAGAFAGPVPVEPLLFALLLRCRELYLRTEGAFDVTAGPLIRAWGFRRRDGRVPDAEEIERVRKCVGMDKVDLDEKRKTIRFTEPGMEINLGSIGKGYALDRVAVRFRQARFGGVLLSAGHSSMLAVGSPPWDEAWQIDLLHPHHPDRALATVRLRDQGLSTSGVCEQFFEQDGRRYGHLIDPRTGIPACGMLQASVVAPDAALAEALSTACFVLGPDWAEDYCRRNPGVGAILLSDPGPDHQPRVHLVGTIEASVLPVGGH